MLNINYVINIIFTLMLDSRFTDSTMKSLSDKACRKLRLATKDLPKCTATLSSDDEGF